MAVEAFSSTGYQVLSSLIYFLGLTILTTCASKRLPGNLTSIASIRQMSWPRLCVFLIMIDSWLFLFSSGLLIFGVGMETFAGACKAGPIMCVIFYGSSKVFIYCFLVEKVHLVWSPTAETGGRMKSRIWKICMALNAGYVVVVVLMCLGLIHYYRADGACIIGLEPFSSIPLIAFDLFITIVLNILFLYPLFSSKVSNPKIRAVALRTVAASIVALITSTVNIAILTVLHGHELGWVCLGSCGTDVILNALTIFFVTRKSDNNSTLGDPSDHERSRTHHTPSGDPISKPTAFKIGAKNKNSAIFAGRQTLNGTGEAHALQVMVTTRTSMDRDYDSDKMSDKEKFDAMGPVQLSRSP
ncbi:hypothetical protein V5O48_014613 [Marasmius crinis-equi]|uniref:Transmembrane protein n=1 Tax=Marasmius crinis-equi TaxID=585013 RepID=A0ABR3EWU8_9AGAR